MALYLITGTPGSGKTLNTLETVHKRAIEEKRPVYYANIELTPNNKIKFDNWTKLENQATDRAPSVYNWYDCPEGSIILIDECQDFFPPMGTTTKRPEYITKFATHRHQGFDIYLITQGPALINSSIKDWVQPHIHYRRIWGGNSTYKYENEQCINNIRNINEIARAAIKSRIKLNKDYFGTYQSSVFHTENKRIPKKLIYLFTFASIASIGGITYLYTFFNEKYNNINQEKQQTTTEKPEKEQHKTIPAEIDFLSETKQSSLKEKTFNPITDYQPRIEGLPETAPAYDELRRPKSFPRPQCLKDIEKNICQCFSQQATLLVDYPIELCESIVKRGYFDPTKTDPARQEIKE